MTMGNEIFNTFQTHVKKRGFNPTHAEVEMAIAEFIKDGGVIQELPDEIQCAVDAVNFQIMHGVRADDFSMI